VLGFSWLNATIANFGSEPYGYPEIFPSIVPGLGMGVSVGERVSVIVGVRVTVGVEVGVRALTAVLVGCPEVGDAKGVSCGADWVKDANVRTTFVATRSGIVPPGGVPTFGKLQAPNEEARSTERINLKTLFIFTTYLLTIIKLN
jgi:hypothetical protein